MANQQDPNTWTVRIPPNPTNLYHY